MLRIPLLTLLTTPLLLTACDNPGTTPARTETPPPASAASTAGPTVKASGSVMDGASVDGVGSVVDEMIPAFKQCYVSALATDPGASGTVRVTLEVGSTGAIGSASTAASKGIGKQLANCIASHARKSKFSAPKGPRSTIMITVSLSP